MPSRGKDITDPEHGEPEIRGGEKPDDWTGPLPEREGAPPDPPPEDVERSALADPAVRRAVQEARNPAARPVSTPPGTSMPIVPGPQDELSELDT